MRTFTTKHTVYSFNELSEEAILETIECNEYEFYGNGRLA